MGDSGLFHHNGMDIQKIEEKLIKHADKFSLPEYHLKHLTQSSNRFQNFSLGINGFFMDFSRQRMDKVLIEDLYELADSSGAFTRFKEMVKGARVNTTEKRAALHTAARGTGPSSIMIDGIDAPKRLSKVNSEIKTFTEAVHDRQIKTKDGLAFTHTVVVGIGGSYLGCEFVYQAMGAGMDPQMPITFLPNVDMDDFSRVIKEVPPKTTLWIVISKSFTTVETLANMNQISSWLEHQGIDPGAHLVTITAKGSPGDTSETNVLKSFHIFDFIGGRYSVSSAVGGLPLSLAFGYQAFEDFLSGCRDMDNHTLSSLNSIPMTAALISVWNTCFLNYPAQAIIPYASRLAKLPAHIQQLHMESIGKAAGNDNTALSQPRGLIIFGEPGTNAQHSFFQLAHQGPGFPIDFIGIIQPGFQGELSYTNGITNHQELWVNLLAQTRALALGCDHENPSKRFSGNRPSSLIMLDRLDPESIGKLLAFYEARTVLEGFILGINPFDQFGVELGKTMAGDIRQEMAQKNQADSHGFSHLDDASEFYLNRLFKE